MELLLSRSILLTLSVTVVSIIASLFCIQTDGRELQHRRISLWIERKETLRLIGVAMDFYIVTNGILVAFLRNSAKELNSHLPILPPELVKVEFMWTGGSIETYSYWFKEIRSLNHEILYDPLLSVELRGTVPRNSTGFHLSVPCTFHSQGVASFIVELHLHDSRWQSVPGFPLNLQLRKRCNQFKTEQKTSKEKCTVPCINGGVCGQKGLCICAKGYTGKLCQKALCNQWCGIHGRCVEFNRCKCHRGWRGRFCNKTLNGSETPKEKNRHKKENRQKKMNKTSAREKEDRDDKTKQKQKKTNIIMKQTNLSTPSM